MIVNVELINPAVVLRFLKTSGASPIVSGCKYARALDVMPKPSAVMKLGGSIFSWLATWSSGTGWFMAWISGGMAVSGVPNAAAALELTAAQQVAIGYACDGTYATYTQPINACGGTGTD